MMPVHKYLLFSSADIYLTKIEHKRGSYQDEVRSDEMKTEQEK